ncbi:hypothetical protein N7448_009214 [Penicillium atrosanguineum]|uniref:Rhodopsin domain-containing protein n=1 Tax=Penicillium atrosanguineum TaxID=1132637 RepID=A0A9W9Q0M2_9EURO|nr:uncharacterized protein N7443_006462 [Penicillium atrosanguineum]KAJ5123117.1 hypothetical protein N7448_009214 [Penicillium atrosanguineum]KAJ5141748.1 hypothetical protein N7526_002743 [Penicillium atrosanguineum]KAJ5298342.1 hypothetical protein N7443_006462 [Penicillium atrosanguineum]KAJ5321390.1 hypothetical protein N7476_004392 [Penicillium atrosanguineum]
MANLVHEMIPRSEDDGYAQGKRAMVVTAVLTSIAAVIVAMRLFARLKLMKSTGLEDWSILISLVFSIIYLALVAAQFHFKMGVHSDQIPPHILQEQLKCLWAAIPMYNASLAFTKFSILFQYLRIFPARSFRIACYTVMAIVATYSSWAIVSGYVNCVPVAKFWNHDLPGSCLNFEAVWFFNASMNIATDVTLLALPMPLLVQLQLPRVQKIALMGVFAMGILVVITSILRLSSLQVVAQSTDTSYSNVGAAYWTAAECNVAIICACLPFLRPIISRIFPKLLSTNSHNRYTTYGRTVQTATKDATASRSPRVELFSQNMDKDYDMYSINVKPGDRSSHSSLGGIEVTTEMTVSQETTKHDDTASERHLVSSPV